jgi:hypothetical protein
VAFLDSLTLSKTLPCLAEPGKLIVIGRPSRSIDGLLPLVAVVAPNVIAFNLAGGTLTLRRTLGFISKSSKNLAGRFCPSRDASVRPGGTLTLPAARGVCVPC